MLVAPPRTGDLPQLVDHKNQLFPTSPLPLKRKQQNIKIRFMETTTSEQTNKTGCVELLV